MFERPARRQLVRSAALFAASLLIAAAPAAARQAIVANDPIVLPASNPAAADREQPEKTPATAIAPVETASKPEGAAAKPLIEVPPAGTTLGTGASASSLHGWADSPPAIRPVSESKPLGRPNGTLSARPADGGAEAKAGLASKLDPRSNEVIRLTLAIIAVAAALLIFKVILKRFSAAGLGARGTGARPSGVVEILARFPVGRGQQLLLIKLGRRIVLAHQAGSSMTTISEVTEPEEVASLLGRMEAGSSGRDAAKFQATLNDFVQEHEAAGRRKAASAPRTLPSMEAELVDLTRRPSRGLGSLLGKRVAS